MYAISPDKSKIVFVKNRGGSDVNLWIQELAGGSPSGPPWRLTDGPAFTAVPAFSPDGSYVAYSARNRVATDIWIVSSSSGSPTRLTDSRKTDSHPAWSPEGNALALISERSGSAQIWIAPVQDGKRTGSDRMINTGEVAAFLPTWSPDGKKIAFLGRRQNNYDVWMVAVDGGSPPEQLTSKGKVKHLQWVKSGDLFVSADWGGSKTGLYIVSPMTRAVSLFQPYLDFGKPDGSGIFEVSPDGCLVVFSRESQKGDIWLLKAKSQCF
jgi:TolB protein